MNRRHVTRRRTAYSLAEVLISSALVGVVMVVALDSVGGSVRVWRAATESIDAQTLVNDLTAEILAQPHRDPDFDDPANADFGVEPDEPSPPTNRAAFDDVDDYKDYAESPPKTKAGVDRSGYEGWSVLIDVEKLQVDDASNTRSDGHSDDDSVRVTVTVRDPDGAETTRQAIRSYAGATTQRIGVEVDAVTALSVTLRTGAGAAISAETSLLNHASGP